MPATTTIDIQPLWELEGGPIMGFYAKGHHEAAAFLRALLDYVTQYGYDDELPMVGDEPDLQPEQVSLTWWRWVPWVEDGSYEGMTQRQAEPGSRGSFKVTWWEK